MQIRITTRPAAGREADVAIELTGPTRFGEIRAALNHAAGCPVDAAWWRGDSIVTDDVVVGGPDLPHGCVLTGAPGRPRQNRAGVALQFVGGAEAGRVEPLAGGRLIVGRGADCDITLADDGVSRKHALLEVAAGTVAISDLASTNGTLVDGQSLTSAPHPLRPADTVRLGNTLLAVATASDPPAARRATGGLRRQIIRAPRTFSNPDALHDVEVALPAPERPPRRGSGLWFAALVPAVAGAAIAWFTHSPEFLLFALLSPAMAVSGSLGDRVHWRRSRRRATARRAAERVAVREQIAGAVQDELRTRRRVAPDPAALELIATTPTVRVWERSLGDADWLRVRLGTGDLPSLTRVRTERTTSPAATLCAVPVTVDLTTGPLGLAGPPEAVDGLARWVVTQVLALHSPGSLTVSLLLDPDAPERWRLLRWAPHTDVVTLHDDDRPVLVRRLLARAAAQPAGAGAPWTGPWTVLIVDRAERLAATADLARLVEVGARIGVAMVCVAESVAGLPSGCATVATLSGSGGVRLDVRHPAQPPGAGDALTDRVDHEWAERVTRGLADLVDAGTVGTGVAASCGLAELHPTDADAVARRWACAGESAVTAIGLTDAGPLELDLAADGPHALIAGTTGAGKSELLQAVVAGLAIDQPPDRLSVLLIDYKGGAAFAGCARLPHCVGLVTDLDPALTRRALRSLHAELRRRERRFAEAGVGDLVGYRRAAASPDPMSRLVIVVDEFATLVEELPDFVRGLVAVAQRGRSLGVHLVLATQRPGGVVSADIRANTAIRLCLRVTDPADSAEVLDAADAAGLSPATPGRGLARIGSTVTAFQSAWPGRPAADPDRGLPRVTRIDTAWSTRGPAEVSASADAVAGPEALPGAGPSRTDLDDLIALIADAARRTGHRPVGRVWLPPPPEVITPETLPELLGRDGAAILDGTVGVIDLPDEQRYAALRLDQGDSLVIAGAARSGRTTALVDIALAHAVRPPDEAELYVIDPAGRLSQATVGLPHRAAAVADGPGALRLLERLAAETGGDPETCIHRLLLIDDWDRLLDGLGDLDAIRAVDLLAAVLRTGPTAGVTVALSGDRSVLAPRLSAGFARRIALRLNDPADLALLGIAARDIPTGLPPGRGVRAGDTSTAPGATGATLVQFVCRDTDSLAAEVARLRTRAGTRTLRPDAVRVRPLPDTVTADALGEPPAGSVWLGVGGDEAEPLAVDLFGGCGRVLVAGPPRSGRTTLLRQLADQYRQAGGVRVLAVAGPRSALTDLADRPGVTVLQADARPGPVPSGRTLVLVDDVETIADTALEDGLIDWLRASRTELALVVSGRADELATTYRGLAAEVRRARCGVLLRPAPVDGDLLSVHLPRTPPPRGPGRAVVVGEASWGARFAAGEPVPVQVAR